MPTVVNTLHAPEDKLILWVLPWDTICVVTIQLHTTQAPA